MRLLEECRPILIAPSSLSNVRFSRTADDVCNVKVSIVFGLLLFLNFVRFRRHMDSMLVGPATRSIN